MAQDDAPAATRDNPPPGTEPNGPASELGGGLSAAQAARRLAQEGPNSVAPPRRTHLVTRVGRQLVDPLIVLLLVALAVTIAIGRPRDGIIIALVVIGNTAIGVAQEVRADRAIAALNAMAAPTARVIRDGKDTVIPAAELVRGDFVWLEAGDVVPADLSLNVAHRLQLNESALTGESVPVSREVGDEALAGTVVTTGRVAGTVVRVGAGSGLGRISALVASTRPGPTPLQRRLAGLGRVLGLAAVLLSGLVAGIGLLQGRALVDMAVTGVSLVVAAVPESLPAVVTLALALAARRMAGQRAIPRRLHAVETLGSVTVIASDKTGTLTEGRMAVQRAVAATGIEYTATGQGYDPSGSVIGSDGAPMNSAGLDFARAGLLCSDAVILPPSPDHPQWWCAGDPLEGALVVFAARAGLVPEVERAAWPRVGEQPFDQQARRMTTVHTGPDGQSLVICKGAPEAILTHPIVDEVPAGALAAAARLAEAGLRVIAIAAGPAPDGWSPASPTGGGAAGNPPYGLRFLGLFGVGDPVRDIAPQIARQLDSAGIRLLLITGDHPATAGAIGRQVGIYRDGDEMHNGDEGAPEEEQTNRVRVFARTQPEQKLDIVAALQSRGHVVAMTGDGVNDAPALRKADIGVAMGGGTEVARQAADLVLVDDNLATVAAAVREGRRIYDNIRRFLHYAISGGLAEIIVMLAGPFLGLGVTLLPAQILWINLMTHGVPGVALGAEPAEPGLMDRPPRPPAESVLGAGLGRRMLGTAAVMSVIVLLAGWVAHQLERPFQSITFAVLGLAQLGVAIAVRAKRRPGGERNPGLGWAVTGAGVLMIGAVTVPPLAALLGAQVLDPLEILVCAAVASGPGLVLTLARRLPERARERATVRNRANFDHHPAGDRPGD